jgi:hypothetical protein
MRSANRLKCIGFSKNPMFLQTVTFFARASKTIRSARAGPNGKTFNKSTRAAGSSPSQ